ncbi:MAG: SDR family oxidoreductase [Clostridia bacterium]|nr:SDR family oxidoreductase [Clostridia bacterium]
MARVVLVTGGSSGIGRAIADRFSRNGDMVYELSRSGRSREGVTHLEADVTDPEAVSRAVRTVLDAQGRIDVLVNNAGYGISGPVESTPPAKARALFEVNVFGALHCIQAVLPAMRAAGAGHIINISSVAAPIAIPFQAFYSMGKAATNALTLALRSELRPFRIRVCAVQPGDVRTGFTGARVKFQDPVYGEAAERAVAAMERDEQGGMPPEAVARVVFRAASRRAPKALWTVGGKYKLFLFLFKLLPASLSSFIVGRMYG